MADRRRRRRNSSHSDSDHSETDEPEVPKVVERRARDSECESEVGTPATGDVSEYESATETNDDEYSDEDTTEYDDSIIVEGSEYGTESLVDEERQSGDGEEQPDGGEKPLDDDEDQKNPAYIPRKGAFYEHDSRLSAEDGEEKRIDPLSKKKLWLDAEKWEHDKYNDSFQAPKSREELIAIYGYDIRASDKPPDSIPRFNSKPRGHRSDQGPSLGDYIDKNRRYDNQGYNNRRGSDSRGRGRGGRGGPPRGRGGFDPIKMSYRESQGRSYGDMRNQYRDRAEMRQSGDRDNRSYNENNRQPSMRGRPNDRQYRGKSSSPEQYPRNNNDNRNYNQERRYSGPPGPYSNGAQYEKNPYPRERDNRPKPGPPPPRGQEGPTSHGEQPPRKPTISRREDDFIPILTTEIVVTSRNAAQYTQAGSQQSTKPTGSGGVSAPQPKQQSPPAQKPHAQSGGKVDGPRDNRPKRYSSQRQRPSADPGFQGDRPDPGNPPVGGPNVIQGPNVPPSGYYPGGAYPNPGAPVFQPQSEQAAAPGVAPYPAPPRMRQPAMVPGPYPIPVSSTMQSPPRLYHQAGISAPTSTMSPAPALMQNAGGAYIRASVVRFVPPVGPPGVAPPGVGPPSIAAPPGPFPIVQYPGPPQAPIPAPVAQPPLDPGQMRGGTTYFPPEAQTVRNVRGGTTYFNPDIQQISREWCSPVRRPKLAIPIVNPQAMPADQEGYLYDEDQEHFVDAQEVMYLEDGSTPHPGIYREDGQLPPEFHPGGQYYLAAPGPGEAPAPDAAPGPGEAPSPDSVNVCSEPSSTDMSPVPEQSERLSPVATPEQTVTPSHQDPSESGDTADTEGPVLSEQPPTTQVTDTSESGGHEEQVVSEVVVAEPVVPESLPAEPVPVPAEPAPVTSDAAPVSADPAPVTSDAAPVSADPAPVTVDPAQVSADPAPVTDDPAPVSVDLASVTVDPTPVSADLAPVTVDPAPVSADPALVTVDPAQVSADPAPVTDDPAPVSADLAPVTVDPTPVSAGLAPVTVDPAPVSADLAPVTVDPAPVSADLAPVTVDPAPVSADLAPVSVDPAPVSADPAPVSADPAPVTDDPAPVSAEPEPVPAEPRGDSEPCASTQEAAAGAGDTEETPEAWPEEIEEKEPARQPAAPSGSPPPTSGAEPLVEPPAPETQSSSGHCTPTGGEPEHHAVNPGTDNVDTESSPATETGGQTNEASVNVIEAKEE